MKLRVILTGATGMVGEGVLHECLNNESVEKVLSVSRKPCGTTHDKLTELIIPDLSNLDDVLLQLAGYNACFFCAGVTSIGKNEAEYTKLTYELTTKFAKTLNRLNTKMTFCYISGAGTDSTEHGKNMWARVKGKTENTIMAMGFQGAYMFRPGYIHPTPGLKYTQKFVKYISWMYPFLKIIANNSVSTLKEVGLSMINVAKSGYSKQIIEVQDIHKLAA